jgi:hypothetical protein
MTGTPSYFDEEFEMASNSRAFASRDEGCCDRTGEVLIYCDVACSPKPKLIIQLYSPHQPPAPSAR